MYQTNETGEMAPKKRFQEIASILTKGYLRMKKHVYSPDSSQSLEKYSQFTKKGLDCPAQQSVHVTTG